MIHYEHSRNRAAAVSAVAVRRGTDATFTRRALLYLSLGILVGMPALTTVMWLIAKATGWLK
jgi:hypothetical protein